jgi:hypothetical protein
MEDKAKKILIESFKDVNELAQSDEDFPFSLEDKAEIAQVVIALFKIRMKEINPSERT